jgi:hypothetical protein
MLQELTEDQLKEVERLARLQLSHKEVGLIVGYIVTEASDTAMAAFGQAMLRGRLLEEAELRTSVFELAKAGSAPAQTLAMQLVNQARVAAAGL